jgi:hypothetical protein
LARTVGTGRVLRSAMALGMAALLALLARPSQAAIVFSEPSGITSQPTDDPRWNSTVQWQQVNGGGTIIGSQYFLTAQHLNPVIGDTVSLTTVTGAGGVTATTTYTTSAVTNIPNTDMAVWQINGTFPSSSIVPLYSNAPGTETGQAMSMLGYGFHVQGAPVVTNTISGPVQNGWLWGGNRGFNGEKNFGTNTVAGITHDGPAMAPTLISIFSPIAGSQAIVTSGDSGGGVFINVGGVEQLAGVQYAVMQFFSTPDAGSALNAAIYDTTGLYLQTNTGFSLASDFGITGQYGYASEIAPFIGQIQQIIGVPEPSGVVLAVLGFALLLAAGRRKR